MMAELTVLEQVQAEQAERLAKLRFALDNKREEIAAMETELADLRRERDLLEAAIRAMTPRKRAVRKPNDIAPAHKPFPEPAV
jgi:predicted  nucleic acid-binding Zn-ribbon protein